MKILPPNGGNPPTSQKPRESWVSPLLGKSATSSPTSRKKLPPEVMDKLRRNRRGQFALMDAARQLVCERGREAELDFPQTYHRVATCRWSLIGRVGFVRFSDEGRGYLTNIETCGSVWSCPMCAAMIQERRRAEIAQAIQWAYEQGFQPVMITFTFPHGIEHRLLDLLQRQAKAFELLRKGRVWDLFKKSIGYEGLIRSLEVTNGANGWHPHTHEMFFVSDQVEAEQLQARLTDLWESACVRAGLVDRSDVVQMYNFAQHAVKVIGWCSASDYLAKLDDSRHWGVDHELSKAVTKDGRASGMHPFGLLAAAAAGDAAAGERYMEYLDGMRAKRQLFWSRNLKKRAGLKDCSDEEIAAEIDPTLVLTAGFDSLNYNRVCRLGKRALMLETAEAGYAADGVYGAQQFLTAFFLALYGMERG